jgi:site-specific DNA-methyltransferase (adenine-specific)
MGRVEQLSDGIALHLGDCREVLPQLGQVDLVVTDPPYLLTSGGNTATVKALGGWLGSYGNNGNPLGSNIEWLDIMRLVFDALKDDGDCYVMANDKNVILAGNAAAFVGFGFHNLLVWDKCTAIPNRWYMKNCEFTLYLWKGKAKTIRDPASKQLCFVPNTQDAAHPTAKPVELMAHYICNSSDVGDLVLDPFMGVGSTGVACARRGRKFIGIEQEQKYFDIACRRIGEAIKQGEMFVERSRPGEQGAML